MAGYSRDCKALPVDRFLPISRLDKFSSSSRLECLSVLFIKTAWLECLSRSAFSQNPKEYIVEKNICRFSVWNVCRGHTTQKENIQVTTYLEFSDSMAFGSSPCFSKRDIFSSSPLHALFIKDLMGSIYSVKGLDGQFAAPSAPDWSGWVVWPSAVATLAPVPIYFGSCSTWNLENIFD